MKISELFESDTKKPLKLDLSRGDMVTVPMGDETMQPIKLGSVKRKEGAEAFMRDLETVTQEHPFTRGMRYFEDGPVLVSIHPDDYHGPDVVSLDDIQSKAPGAGAKAMQTICGIADAHDVTIILYAKGYAHVPTEKLVEYYERFDFFVTTNHGEGEGVDMERHPQ
jgi:hypothetical protein